MGLFGGGGGGGVDISGGVNAIQQGTQQGISALNKYYKEALPFLKDNFQLAQAQIAPYTTSGYNALDELYDTLGVARPEAGSYKLNSALKNEQALSEIMNAKGTPAQSTAGWLKPESFLANTGYSPTNLSNHSILSSGMTASFDPASGSFYSAANGAMDSPNWTLDPAKYGLEVVEDPNGGYKLQSLTPEDGTQPRPLTADEQAQWDMIQNYKAGKLAMTNPDDKMASVLEQLQNSPGYQFNLQQGLQGVDRSAAARGLLNSGAAIKGATQFSQGLAENTYNNRVQQLAGAAGLGQQASGAAAGYNAGLGTGLANAALGMGSNTASLYGAQAQGLAQLYGAQAAAQAQQSAANSSGLFSLAGSVLGMFSDLRLKKDIIPTGEVLPNGLPVYEFSYIWDTDERHIGVMAQDVLKVKPEAVGMRDGFLTVDYTRLV